MKKLFYSLFALAMTAMTFTACEDVPAPYDLPTEQKGGGENPKADPTGSGTIESPFNVSAAHDFIDAGEGLDNDVYVEGTIVSVKEIDTGNFGNATYYISDDGTSSNQLEVYRGMSLGNKKFKASDEIKAGDKVVVCGRLVNYGGNTHEFTQGNYIYKLNGEEYKEEAGEAKGSGTQADPYNAAGAIQYINTLAADATSPKDVYIKGKIASIANNGEFSAQFGNATFYISDDGTDKGTFYVFRTLYLGNRKWQAGDTQIKVGDDVIICGKVVNYKGNTPETSANESYIYSLNGKTGDGGQSGADMGSKDSPITVAKAVEIINGMADNETSEGAAYVKGKIVQIKTTDENIAKYKNIDYVISDDGTDKNTMTVFRGKNIDGADFTKAGEINVGDVVVVYGKLQKYVNNSGTMTPELAQGNYLISINGGGSSGGDSDAETGDNGNFETWADGAPTNWKTASSAGNATLSQSNTAHGGVYSVKVGGTSSSNKRLGYKELKLKAGKYTLKFYARADSDKGAAVRPGYVPVTDGTVGSYVYRDGYTDVNNNGWTEITHEFTLDADGTYSIVIMNSKNPGGDVLIDDVTLTTGNKQVIK